MDPSERLGLPGGIGEEIKTCSAEPGHSSVQVRVEGAMKRIFTKLAILMVFLACLAGVAPAWVAPGLTNRETTTSTPQQQQDRIAALEQEMAAEKQQLAESKQQTAEAKTAGDNAWMLTSAALVLFMTGPGLGPVLRRIGAQEERAVHHDAELRHDGHHHRVVGAGGLQPVLRPRQRFHRRLPARLPARRRRGARSRLRAPPFRTRPS